MRAEAIRSHLRKQPFRPIRAYISDGASYDVRHPAMMFITQIEVYIAIDPGNQRVRERAVYCDPKHITRIESIDGARRNPRRKRRAS